jgi:MIP family channel proteins
MAAAGTGKGQYTAEPEVSALRATGAEFVGTLMLVLAGTAVAVAATLRRPIAGSPSDSLAVGLTFGLTLTALVAALGHISGAHFNPAVTLGLASAGRFPWRYVASYIVAQFAGAIGAALLVWAVFGGAARSVAALGATYPTATASVGQAFVVELVVTFILVFTITAVATDDRVPAPVAAPAIGFALAVAVLISGPIAGGAVNPARALGPMIVAGKFTAWWVYIVAPLTGGIAAATFYEFVISKTSAPKVARPAAYRARPVTAEGHGAGPSAEEEHREAA